MELSLGVAAMTLSVQADLADESNSSEMRLFRIAISGFWASVALRRSRSEVRRLAASERWGGVIGD